MPHAPELAPADDPAAAVKAFFRGYGPPPPPAGAPVPCRVRLSTSGLTRAEFVAAHVLVCTARPARKWDPGLLAQGKNPGYRSLAYSRRKCAKTIWRAAQARRKKAPRE